MSRMIGERISRVPTPEDGRRGFLSRLVWLGLLGLGPLRASATVAHRTAPDPRLIRLREIVPHTESAVVVGREYLRMAPAERDPARLAALISSCCGEGLFDSDGDEDGMEMRKLRMRLQHSGNDSSADDDCALVNKFR